MKDRFRQTWPDLALVFLLSCLPFLFFWRLITPNPADRMQIAGGDFTEQYFPLRAFTAQEWVNGRIPLWNPYLYGGQPALADIQSGALYPPHVGQALLLGWGGPLVGAEIGFPLWALEHQVIAHFSLAAVGTYLFGRHLGRQLGFRRRQARFGGLMASLVFTYSGYLTGFPVQQVTILETGAWLPWVMWGLSAASGRGAEAQPFQEASRGSRGAEERRSGGAEERRNSPSRRLRAEAGEQRSGEDATNHASRVSAKPPRGTHRISHFVPAAWGALALALAILAGHPQTVLYIVYLSLAYALFLTAFTRRNLKTRSPLSLITHHSSLITITSPLIAWLVLILLGGLLAAAQILPTLEFIRHSVRADLAYEAVSTGLPLNELISILYPGFFGGSPAYVGIAPLVLISLAVVLGRPQGGDKVNFTPSPHLLFWLGAMIVSLLLAFGSGTFLYSLFYLLAPGFEAVRQQERVFLVYSFSAAVLAGFGAMLVTSPLPRLSRRRLAGFTGKLRGVAGLFFALTGFFLYGSARATARGDEVNLFYGVLWHHLFGLIILAGVMGWLALRLRRGARRSWAMAGLALWLAFNLFTVNWRFNLAEPAEPAPFTPTGLIQFLQTNLPTFPSSTLPLGRIASGGHLPGGHSAASVYHLPDLTGNTPLQLATVNTFLTQMPAWRLWQLMNVVYVVDKRDVGDAGLIPVFAGGETRVFEMGDPFPRAWFVSQSEVIPEPGAAIARLAAGDFDLRRTAVVAEALPASLQEASGSSVQITDIKPVYLKAEVMAEGEHLLVFSQIYYPGWQAKIDGRPVEVRQVNAVQQGLLMPPGRHTVELYFAPDSFWWGVAGSTTGGLIWLAIMAGANLAKKGLALSSNPAGHSR